MSSFIPFTSEAEIIAIGHGLVNRTLPKVKWTLAAHFAAALWLVDTGRGSTVPAVIRAYNESTGVDNTDKSVEAPIMSWGFRILVAFIQLIFPLSPCIQLSRPPT
jgi:hypothetical protein